MKSELDSITIRLPLQMKKDLQKLAAERDLTVSQLIRQRFARKLSPAPVSMSRPKAHTKKGAKKAA